MISIADYYMGRDKIYGDELTPQMHLDAAETVRRLNLLKTAYEAAGVQSHINPKTGSVISSGWRPDAINAATTGAKPFSKHKLCMAGDLYDPEGDIDEWALDNPDVLKSIGLWQEHPSSTKGWAHFQTVPPRSGNRVFYP